MPAPAEPSVGTVGWQSSWLKPILDSLADGKVPSMSVTQTATTGTNLTVNAVNPTDATAAPLTRNLPTGVAPGSQLAVIKTDASANAVTISGNLRGVTNATTTLVAQNEAVLLLFDGATYWPIASHRPKASLDAAYVPASTVGATNGVASLDNTGHLLGTQLPTNVATFASFPDVTSAQAAGAAGQLNNVTFVLVG